MLIFLSPAKSLDYKTPPHVAAYTQPAYLKQSETLIKQLRKLSPYWGEKGPAANPQESFAPTYA